MSQKSSVPQAVSFVSQVLKRDMRQDQPVERIELLEVSRAWRNGGAPERISNL